MGAAWEVFGQGNEAIGLLIYITIIPILYFVVCRLIIRSDNIMPRATMWAFVGFFALSVLFASYGFGETLRYYGWGRAIALAIQAIVPPILIIGAWLRLRRRLTRDASLVMHLSGFAWLSWSAFPWWGELI